MEEFFNEYMETIYVTLLVVSGVLSFRRSGRKNKK